MRVTLYVVEDESSLIDKRPAPPSPDPANGVESPTSPSHNIKKTEVFVLHTHKPFPITSLPAFVSSSKCIIALYQ